MTATSAAGACELRRSDAPSRESDVEASLVSARTNPISPADRELPPAAGAAPKAGSVPGRTARTTRETVRWLHWWTPALVSFRVTRNPAFRFSPGHYARLGVADRAGHTVFRPLSIASAPEESHLEFFCSVVPGGEFSGRLAGLRVGDPVEVETASFGFLTVDDLAPGTDLWLLATGTGLAPFVSMLRDARVWQEFANVIVVHSVRRAAELAYADDIRRLADLPRGSAAPAALHYLPVVTREPGMSTLADRIPALLASGELVRAAGVALDPVNSRVMACGNPDMTRDLRALLDERGFRTTRRGVRGQVAFEKYW